MSGSGSVCFGLFDRRTPAAEAARALATSRVTTTVTRTQTASEFAVEAVPFPARQRR
jgi:4-diphosphocytidyl-2C-methyl-D-erythritol kinase